MVEAKNEMREFLTAFVKVQKALKPAKKDSINPHFKSKYADLASCYEACRDVLSDNGFSIIQQTWLTETQATMLKTNLYHISGQFLVSEFFVCGPDVTAQAKGSALTYARRYSLCTIVGIAPDDDDGHAATEGHVKPKPQGAIAGPFGREPQAKAGEFVIPFGPSKGTKVKDLPQVLLEKNLQWLIDNDKAPEYQEAILAHLDIITQVQEPGR